MYCVLRGRYHEPVYAWWFLCQQCLCRLPFLWNKVQKLCVVSHLIFKWSSRNISKIVLLFLVFFLTNEENTCVIIMMMMMIIIGSSVVQFAWGQHAWGSWASLGVGRGWGGQSHWPNHELFTPTEKKRIYFYWHSVIALYLTEIVRGTKFRVCATFWTQVHQDYSPRNPLVVPETRPYYVAQAAGNSCYSQLYLTTGKCHHALVIR